MTPQQAFKFGFFARCVEDNLDLPVVKAAWDRLCTEKRAFASLDNVTQLGLPLLTALIGGPIALGGVGAYAKNKLSDVTDTELEVAKKNEILQTYKDMTEQAKRQLAIRQRRKESGKNPRVLF